MRILKFYVSLLLLFVSTFVKAQIQLTPIVDTTIEGLTENNVAIVENRLRSFISSHGMISSYGGRFVLACKIAILEREVAGIKPIQHLEVTFAVGDNVANKCFGTASVECLGIGNSQEQAMTAALRNIKGDNPELEKLLAVAKERIIDYYDQNALSIIAKAKALANSQQWDQAIYELSAIPQECSSNGMAVKLIDDVYQQHINHDAAQVLNEARAVWSADPNPGPAAEQAMSFLTQIDTSSKCYPQAMALMNTIQARVKNVSDSDRAHEKNMERRRLAATNALQRERINACRDIAVAYAKRKVLIQKHYHSWW